MFDGEPQLLREAWKVACDNTLILGLKPSHQAFSVHHSMDNYRIIIQFHFVNVMFNCYGCE